MKSALICFLIFSSVLYSAESNKADIMQQTLSSALDMFSIAAKKYEKGELTKEQFIKIALEVNKISEMAKTPPAESKGPLMSSIVPGNYAGDRYSEYAEINKEILPKIKADYQAFLKSTKPGEVKDWGNGKLYRREFGALFVANSDGDSVFLHDMTQEDLDYQRIATLNKTLFNFWNEKYGFKLYVPGIAYLMYAAEQSKPVLEYEEKILSWITSTTKSLKPGQSKAWEGMTVVRTANPGCLMLLSKDGKDMVSVCEKDDFSKTIAENAFLTKVAAKHWGYAAPSK